MLDKFKDYFDLMFDENRLAHSFLIGNVLFDDIKNDLNEIIKKIFNNDNLNIESNPDIYILKNDDSIISKDDIKNLLEEISTTSQFNNNKVYIIDGVEKLNDFADNALLKTLEEPQANIYAFLITNNINSVKPTISSRCQKLYLNSDSDKTETFTDEEKELAIDIIESIETDGVKSIGRYSKIYTKINDRIFFINILKCILNYYYSSLKIKCGSDDGEELEYLKNSDIVTISKKIIVINNTIGRLNSYLNKNLCIDRFIIEMWRCNV